MSTTAYQPSGGLLGWITRVFRFRRQTASPAIVKTVQLLNRMIGDLEVTRKRMDERYNDLARKARDAALKNDRDNYNIFYNEMSEIAKFISLVVHAKKSLMQIKLRLETMLEMGNALDAFPDIISELNTLKPLLARITPSLVDKMAELERNVISIMSSTSLPSLYGSSKPKELAEVSREGKLDLSELLPPKEPVFTVKSVAEKTAVKTTKVTLTVIKKWLLEEIRLTGGFIQVEAFSRKYGVPKDSVIEALRELSEEGKIIIKT